MITRPGTSVLVAGIGNVFLGDDGFGVEVARRLSARPLPPGIEVTDYGIRGLHLAYELLGGRFDTLVMVDAIPLDDPPGTIAVLEVDPDAPEIAGRGVDAHGMDPVAVLGLLRTLGGRVSRVRVVGCVPAVLAEGMGLSDVVFAAVPEAERVVLKLVADLAGYGPAYEIEPEKVSAVGRRNPK
ncbi:hydrogenase maturation protease [Amycolatopsis pigmentata]|uniref:Hydrogenase maturation protease n=1 Tax=Amycolatopsis pigmentata TaxID=450801 RepID=A0ABW5FMG7_9PSEU